MINNQGRDGYLINSWERQVGSMEGCFDTHTKRCVQERFGIDSSD